MDEWYGVVCCPATHANLVGSNAELGACSGPGGSLPAISRANSERHDRRLQRRRGGGGGGWRNGLRRLRIVEAEAATTERTALRFDDATGTATNATGFGVTTTTVSTTDTLVGQSLGQQYCAAADATLGDLATCVVVALVLTGNNLTGTLAFAGPGNSTGDISGLCGMEHLQRLHLANNLLVGALPEYTEAGAPADSTAEDTSSAIIPGDALRDRACFPALEHLAIANNSITGAVPGWVVARQISRLDLMNNELDYSRRGSLLVACYGAGMECTGTPPTSCRAFGTEMEVEASSGKVCVRCELRTPWPLFILIAMLSLFVIFTVSYALLMVLRPHLLKYLFSTISIFIAHLQTLTIVSSLKLAWPPSTKKAMSFLVVNGLQLEAARPECVAAQLRGGEQAEELDVPLFYIMAAAKVALPLLILLLLSTVRWALTAIFGSGDTPALAARRDRLELIETIIFSLILVTSWKAIFDLIGARESGSNATTKSLATAGCVLASVLLVVQAAFILRYYLNYLTMVSEEVDRVSQASHRSSRFSMRFSRLSASRLQYRLSYQTKRFRSHAQHWQFVIWLRQWIQTLIAILPQMLSSKALAHGQVLTGSAAQHEPIVRSSLSHPEQARACPCACSSLCLCGLLGSFP